MPKKPPGLSAALRLPPTGTTAWQRPARNVPEFSRSAQPQERKKRLSDRVRRLPNSVKDRFQLAKNLFDAGNLDEALTK